MLAETPVRSIIVINCHLNRAIQLIRNCLFAKRPLRLLIPLMLLMLSSCSVTKPLDEGEYLLQRNRVRIVDASPETNASASELERYYRQKPNTRMLKVIAFHAAAYNFGEGINLPDSTGFSRLRKWGWKKRSNFRSWVMRNGEAPVVLDTLAADRTLAQMKSFMFTRGHFSADGERSIRYHKKKAYVTYFVFPGPGHTIRFFTDEIPSPGIKKLYDAIKAQSLIREGAPYDEKLLQQERDRITRVLKDSGYYHFNKAYIVVEVDTFLPDHQLDIKLKILDQSFFGNEDQDSVVTIPHLRSRINRVYINPEFEGAFIQKSYQVIPYAVDRPGSDDKLIYHIFTTGNPEFNPQVLIRNVLLEPGQLYALKDVELTYLYLSDLGNFRNISISFEDVAEPDSSLAADTSVQWIDCYINMTRTMKQAYELRMDLTHRSSDPGISTNLVYQNTNLFKGAEVMSLALKGALEVQKILDKDQVQTTIFNNLPFNTIELGAEADIRIPKLVAPFALRDLSKSFKPRTRFAGGVNFQERPDYKRYVVKFTSGYEWQFRPTIAMTLNPLEINSVSIDPDQSFIDKINALNDQRLKSSYSDHIIMALTYTVVIDKQADKTSKRYSFVRFNIESAGLLVNTFRNTLNYPVNAEGIAMIFNIPYAQYLRADVDYRYFFRLKQKDHLVATRLYLGLGNPFGNMDVLPFEKSFFAGGANGIRAWQVRNLGPGSYYNDNELTRFDRTGDLGIEASAEYRFPIYSSLNGALFLDAGNVWLKNKNDKYPGGEFVARNFLSEMALGYGFGLRFVSFFVIRVDAGIRMHDPSKPAGERWVIDEFRFNRINWNFGIGYSI